MAHFNIFGYTIIMISKKIYGWLFLDMILFVLVNLTLLTLLSDQLVVLNDLTFLKLFILGLATYRAANILSNEAITKPLRKPFIIETEKNGKAIEEPKKKGFLGAMGLLITCPSCSGVWLAAVLVYFYIIFPTETLVIAALLSLSAIERIGARSLEWLKTK